ncbi:hypothetical protein FH972_024004 [Carpinus fangiana]|uniref:FHA domain-containing protein n=1 Tax=Carpinus fangiana TaxID=176857 RepID=A0A5N6KX67_9ROSI|nr:hypothetical protein FH972_024004 [Carpinus fangiana]
MTAVASPPSYPNALARNGWSGPGVATMSQDEVSHIFVPRKSAQRSNSSSSLSSQSSTSSSASAASTQSNGTAINGDISSTRRKPPRGLWPSSAKSEPVSGISSARSQPVNAGPSGTSAASAISALHTPQVPSQHMGQGQAQNGTSRGQALAAENPAMLNLMPMNGTFERKTITVPHSPEVLRIGRQTNAKTVPTPLNGYFDSKVLSRQHAEVWAERDGKIWIRDVKSSNGTFVNGKRLSQENRDSEPHPLKENDIVELGIDIISEDQKTVVHHKVAARVEHAGPVGIPQPPPEMEHDAFSQMRNRSGTNHNRFGNNMSAAAYHAKWLQPVTVEQIAKRLQKELRQARLQSQDLQNTGAFVDAVIANANPPPPPPQKIQSPSKSDLNRARFALLPPAPPPNQPLPEKPDAARQQRSSLRRSETERPPLSLLNGSPIRTEGQSIASLVEALTSARSEISTQSEKLKELEDTLVKEREARASAEERAGRLASGSGPNTPIDDSVSPSTDENDPSVRMQHRLELLQAEMEQVRTQMETYRQRAETAESENETSKKSLAEMVESIHKRDRSSLRKRGTKRAVVDDITTPTEEDLDEEGFEDDEFTEEIDSVLSKHLTRQATERSGGPLSPSRASDGRGTSAAEQGALGDSWRHDGAEE